MEQIIERKLLTPILNHLKEKEITIIIGPRQVGKTTILNLLRKHLENSLKISKEDIFYFNLD
ncbi:AAA family ATPase, partial [Patescibacteria group bacterium]|nr:AAA family ATPase [Patescibacteria group bacterium]